MPIYGLTDSTPTFKEVGRIRKGGPKPDQFRPGPNLDHFRPTFRDDEPEAAETFRQLYGEQPTLLNVRLAFNTVQDNWDAWYTCYLKGGMLGKADGKRWHYLRDYRTQQILIKGGELTELGKERGIKLDFKPDEAVYFYRSQRQGKDMPVYARPEGRLRVVLPELGRFVFMTLLTHSLHDIANISAQLEGIAQTAQSMGLKLSQLPIILTRQLDQISKPVGDGRGMVSEWLVQIEIHPDFAPIALKAIDRLTVQALSAPVPATGLLPAPDALAEPEQEPDEEQIEAEEDGELAPGPAFGGPGIEENEPELPGTGETKTEQDELPEIKGTLAEMTLEAARSIISSDGRTYGEIPISELRNHLNGILAALRKKDLTQEERDLLEFKRDAIHLLHKSIVGE